MNHEDNGEDKYGILANQNQEEPNNVPEVENGMAQNDIPRLFLEAENTKQGRTIKLHTRHGKRTESNMSRQSQSEENNLIGRKNDILSIASASTLSASSAILKDPKFDDSMNNSSYAILSLQQEPEQYSVQENASRESLLETNHQSVAFTLGQASSSNDDTNCASDFAAAFPGDTLDELPPPPSYESLNKKVSKNVPIHDSLINMNDTQPPPTYSDATGNSRFLEDAPPDYNVLFAHSLSRIMDLRNSGISSNPERPHVGCLRILIVYLAVLITCLTLISVTVLLPMAMIIVGVRNVHNCPAQPRIPVFLISLGVFQLLECSIRAIYHAVQKARNHNQEQQNRSRAKDPFMYFIVIWFVVGSMWVYQNYPSCVIDGSTETSLYSPDREKTFVNIVDASLNGGVTKLPNNLNKFANATLRNVSSHAQLNMAKTSMAFSSDGTRINVTLPPNMDRNASRNNTLRRAAHTKRSNILETTNRPRQEIEAACCGRTVYFMTFCIISVYYAIFGFVFFLHICTAFIKICYRRCVRN